MIAMNDSPAPMSGMHGHMLVCCGMMVLYFGAIAISSTAGVVGLSTGQTYVSTGGFSIAVIVSLVYIYRRSSAGDPS